MANNNTPATAKETKMAAKHATPADICRFAIVAGDTPDVEAFIDDALEEGYVWYNVTYPVRAPDFPFSSKLEETDRNTLRTLAHRHGVTLARVG
jgi:hypothetical protein